MSNSPLVNYTKISPNSTNPRKKKISKITIHHVAGNLSVETIGNIFAPTSRRASSNYGVDNKGRVGMYVEEKNRAWTSSNADNDHEAITIEVANNGGAPNWPVSDIALNKTVDLCVDICKRNGIKKLNFTGDKTGNLTMHKWFAATSCPGPYLESKFPYIAQEVNKRLNAGATAPAEKPAAAKPATGGFLVKVTANGLNIRQGAGTSHKINGVIRDKGVYTIVETKGSWGKLKSGAGWIHLGYTERLDGSNSAPKPTPAPAKTIKIGSKVKVKRGAKTYTGGNLAGFVYNTVYDVQQISGNRVVIGLKGKVTAAVKSQDLIPQ